MGLGRLQDPCQPRPRVTHGFKLRDRPCHPRPGAAQPKRPPRGLRRSEDVGERGAGGPGPPTWRGVGRRTWGPFGGGNLGPASGLCLQSRQRSPTPKGQGRPGLRRCGPGPRPRSGQLTWAPRRRRRLPRSAPPARLRSARLGRALHSAAPAGAQGAGAGGATRSRLERDAAAGRAGIGRGRWKPGPESPWARPRRLGPAPRREGRWEPEETKVAARRGWAGEGEERGGGGGEGK